jgi:hypothetical protein
MTTSKARDDARLLRKAAQLSERQEVDRSNIMLYNIGLLCPAEDLGDWRERIISTFNDFGDDYRNVSPELNPIGLTNKQRTLGLCFAAAMAETGDL